MNTIKIRRLIDALELCHHKAGRHVELILEAIGSGDTDKGMGTRAVGETHPAERVWQDACDVLVAWSAQDLEAVSHRHVGGIPALELTAHLGEPTPLKLWQVGRIVDKIGPFLDPTAHYCEMVEHGERYRGDVVYLQATLNTSIHDSVDGQEAKLSLASAIDHLEPCHWDFVANLILVLSAIGGDLRPRQPFAACGRNIKRTPLAPRMRVVADTLRAYCKGLPPGREHDASVLRTLGETTPAKRSLAAALEEKIRGQIGS